MCIHLFVRSHVLYRTKRFVYINATATRPLILFRQFRTAVGSSRSGITRYVCVCMCMYVYVCVCMCMYVIKPVKWFNLLENEWKYGMHLSTKCVCTSSVNTVLKEMAI